VPAVVDSGLEGRQALMRTFLVARDDGYVVMPGALTRIGASPHSFLLSNQAGGLSKDTWILATEPEKQVSLLSGASRGSAASSVQTALPGGAADNLFWLGRYAERTEQAIRIVRTALRTYRNAVEFEDMDRVCLDEILAAVTQVTGTHPGFVGEAMAQRRAAPMPELLSVVLDGSRSGSVSFDVQAMLTAAYAVRDRLSGDTWRVINDVRARLERLQARPHDAANKIEDELDALITDLAAMFALAQESMLRGQVWLFLDTGRRVERALLLATLLRTTVTLRREPHVEAQLLEAVLRATESLMPYRRSFHEHPQIEPVLTLVLLDETNPRSLGFQLRQIQRGVANLPHEDGRVELSQEERLVLDAVTSLQLVDLSRLSGYDNGGDARHGLEALLGRVATLLAQVSDVLTRHYFHDVQGPQHLARTIGGTGR